MSVRARQFPSESANVRQCPLMSQKTRQSSHRIKNRTGHLGTEIKIVSFYLIRAAKKAITPPAREGTFLLVVGDVAF